jgi:hypothetical protein
MAAPPASYVTETGANGNLSAGAAGPIQKGDIESALPVMNLSWRTHFRRHQQRFRKLDQALRARLNRVWLMRAFCLFLVLAFAPVMLFYSSGQHMAQAWVMATALCFSFSIVFSLQLLAGKSSYADPLLLTYGLLIAKITETAIGPRTVRCLRHAP